MMIGLLRRWQKRREPQVQTHMDLAERLRGSRNYEPRPQPTLSDLGWVGTEEEAQLPHIAWITAVLVVAGWSTMEIGERLGHDINRWKQTSPAIEAWLPNLYSKFGLESEADLEAWVKQHSAPDAAEKVLEAMAWPPR